jgi:hypothetical protein
LLHEGGKAMHIYKKFASCIMRLIILFLLLPIVSFSQVSYSGKIVDSKTKAAISYVTVGLQKENIGINADESGRFKLSSVKAFTNDTLIFSCVGYETIKIAIDNWKADSTIELKAKEKLLKEVVVKNKWTIAVLGNYSKCADYGLLSTGFQTQVAKHFISPVEKAILKEINICMNTIIFETGKAIFRFRVYNMDERTKAPYEDLCNEIIEVRVRGKNVKVNVEQYLIEVPKDFFIAVEWLKLPYNEEKVTTDKTPVYRPSIGMVLDEGNETWMLFFNHHWSNHFIKATPSINAIIKY